MTFDNLKTIISYRIRLFTVTIIIIAFLILSYAADIIKFPFLGMGQVFWILTLVAIWLFVALFPLFLNYQYVFYSDDTDKIIIRHFTAGITGGRKNSIEIDKRSFAGYKTESGFFGLITSVILFQKFSEGVAKYPPVWISALTREEKSKLFKALNSYIQE
jgi:hypothetical protein